MDTQIRDADRQAAIDPEDPLRQEAARLWSHRRPLTLADIKETLGPNTYRLFEKIHSENGSSIERELLELVVCLTQQDKGISIVTLTTGLTLVGRLRKDGNCYLLTDTANIHRYGHRSLSHLGNLGPTQGTTFHFLGKTTILENSILMINFCNAAIWEPILKSKYQVAATVNGQANYEDAHEDRL